MQLWNHANTQLSKTLYNKVSLMHVRDVFWIILNQWERLNGNNWPITVIEIDFFTIGLAMQIAHVRKCHTGYEKWNKSFFITFRQLLNSKTKTFTMKETRPKAIILSYSLSYSPEIYCSQKWHKNNSLRSLKPPTASTTQKLSHYFL